MKRSGWFLIPGDMRWSWNLGIGTWDLGLGDMFRCDFSLFTYILGFLGWAVGGGGFGGWCKVVLISLGDFYFNDD